MSNSPSYTRISQLALVVFLILILVYLQVSGQSNSPLYGLLLATVGPAITGLLTMQVVQNTVDKIERVSTNANNSGYSNGYTNGYDDNQKDKTV